ncbi:serine/threonine-protein kinase RIO1-like [Stegodyphus dumicola]|nr:serine/threonine-protein kinase RIO1-like [Stegodyphus dumicola]
MDSLSVKMDNLVLDLSDNDESEEFSDGEDYALPTEDDAVHSEKSNLRKEKDSTFQPNDHAYQKFVTKISLDKYENSRLPDMAVKLLNDDARKKESMKIRLRDKNERATVEQVLDPRTRMILFKMLSRGIISEIHGCISTGKEANVYYASASDNSERAVKVYKTAILTFKDRDRYVTGDYRFRTGYCRRNSRKMVQTWAEKEMRNLWRIYSAGLPCPAPVILKSHVLVMEFIGKDGLPAPLLKEVNLSEGKARELYLDCIIMMRNLFQKCKLIHADLSEYNMLYFNGKIIMIDVSQSVELEHPRAIEFLRKDCLNITDFFKKQNVPVMTVRELFDFITDYNINDENIDDYLAEAQRKATSRASDLCEDEKVDEEVFKQAYIPKNLSQVIDVENDVFNEDREILYHSVTGLKPSLTVSRLRETNEKSHDNSRGRDDENDNEENDDDDDDDSSCSENSVSKKDKSKHSTFSRPRDESPNSKKERKKVLKDARREKQQHKVPKHIKKRKEKVGRQNRKLK